MKQQQQQLQPQGGCSHTLLLLLTRQRELVLRCRQRGKPVIVASHLLQSMHMLPIPTRAEVCVFSLTHELSLHFAACRCLVCQLTCGVWL